MEPTWDKIRSSRGQKIGSIEKVPKIEVDKVGGENKACKRRGNELKKL